MLVATALKKQPPSGEMLTTFVANAGGVVEPLTKDLDGVWCDVEGELGTAWCDVEGELGAAWCDVEGELGAALCDVQGELGTGCDVEGEPGAAWCDVEGELGTGWCEAGELGTAWREAGELGAAWREAGELGAAWCEAGELGAAWCEAGELGTAWCEAGELGAAWCEAGELGAAWCEAGELGAAWCDAEGELLCLELDGPELVRPKQGEASDDRLFDGDDIVCVDEVDRVLLRDVLLRAEDGANSCSSKTSLFGGQIPQEAKPFTAFDMVAAFKYASLKRQLTWYVETALPGWRRSHFSTAWL